MAKVDDIHRDVVLHASHDGDQTRLRPLLFPTPLFGLAIRAATRGDEQKLSDTVHKPVSYTHLDVYKRQAQGRLPIKFSSAFRIVRMQPRAAMRRFGLVRAPVRYRCSYR